MACATMRGHANDTCDYISIAVAVDGQWKGSVACVQCSVKSCRHSEQLPTNKLYACVTLRLSLCDEKLIWKVKTYIIIAHTRTLLSFHFIFCHLFHKLARQIEITKLKLKHSIIIPLARQIY